MGLLWGRQRDMAIDAGWASAQGRRPENQDRCQCSARWGVLSDGIGGYAGGATAAQLAVDAAVATLDGACGDEPAVLFDAMRRANSAVRDGRRRHPDWELMGATLTLALAGGQGLWFVANLGDSPGWVVHPDETRQVTEDHNYAAELLRHRVISPAQAACHPGRHVLSRAIGIEEEVSPSICPVDLAPGDRLVLASDGLGGAVDTTLLHDLLGPAGDTSARHQARLLVDLALEGGACDNVTAVVLCRPSSPGGHRPL